MSIHPGSMKAASLFITVDLFSFIEIAIVISYILQNVNLTNRVSVAELLFLLYCRNFETIYGI